MIAIPVYQFRVAPVLDWCSTVLLIPEQAGDSGMKQEVCSREGNTFDLLRNLRKRGVVTVICGAASSGLVRYGEDLGLEIICGVAGPIDEVVQAYRHGQLDRPAFRLPGCRRRCLGGRVGKGDETGRNDSGGKGKIGMPKGQGRGGKGQGRGTGRDGRCATGRGGGQGGGAGGRLQDLCVCPKCGAEAPHTRGTPCMQMKCSACGEPMVRK